MSAWRISYPVLVLVWLVLATVTTFVVLARALEVGRFVY